LNSIGQHQQLIVGNLHLPYTVGYLKRDDADVKGYWCSLTPLGQRQLIIAFHD